MKKKMRILIFLLTAVGIFLAGCAKEAPAGQASEAAADVKEMPAGEAEEEVEDEAETSEVEKEGGEEAEDNEISLPEGFVQISDEEAENLPDIKGLEETAKEAGVLLNGLGVDGIDASGIGNYRDTSGVINLDMYVKTSHSKELLVSFMYISYVASPEWSIVFVKDVNTDNYYYMPDELKNTVDLYDYSTGELISRKSESHEDVQKREEEKVKEAEAELEKNLEELKEKYLETDETGKSRKVSEIKFNDEPIIDVAMRDMKEYDYIKDVYIEVDEADKEIDIVVQIPSGTNEDTAKMAGEDVTRYLASCASWSNSYYKSPGSDDIGGIYDTYDLLIYVDDGLHNYDIYGAKVTTAKKITWRDA